MSEIIKDLNWRYATKKFDPSKKIADHDLEIIKESLRLTPSSYGIQPYKFLLVKNEVIREQLTAASYNQQQVKDASHLIVMCAYNELLPEHVDAYMSRIATTRNVDKDTLTGFSDMIHRTSVEMETEKQKIWMSKQLYIALGQLMHTCAALKIDSTPMEGFKPEEYDRILGLKDQNLHAVLACPIGYRHEEDKAIQNKKVRKSLDEIFEIIE